VRFGIVSSPSGFRCAALSHPAEQRPIHRGPELLPYLSTEYPAHLARVAGVSAHYLFQQPHRLMRRVYQIEYGPAGSVLFIPLPGPAAMDNPIHCGGPFGGGFLLHDAVPFRSKLRLQ
jgi:hypothetical protein